ncbi:MAG: hypothetical protein ACFCUN_03160 [Hyphomicrobiaceae bacterium]
MSGGFDSMWLALREPVDHASVNAELRRLLVGWIGDRPSLRVIDIGAGRGSNVRGLAPSIACRQHWTLIDIDDALLNEAAHTILPSETLSLTIRNLDLATADLGAVLAACDLVTSAAFFDLVSKELVDRVVAAVVQTGAAFYTILTYDGLAAWIPEHPADSEMRRLFNEHQRRDKGLGPALGPAASVALVAAFRARGYRVFAGPSPWIVDDAHPDMGRMLNDGWARAVAETGEMDGALLDAWRDLRSREGTTTIVGHRDVLALPPE